MSDKGMPSYTQIASEFGVTAFETIATTAGSIIDAATIALGNAVSSVDADTLTQEVSNAKAKLTEAASVAVFSLAGKAATHPLGRKAVGAIFAPKSGGKHEANGSDPVSTIVNSAVVLGGDLLNKWNSRKAG